MQTLHHITRIAPALTKFFAVSLLWLFPAIAQAQLGVTVLPPKITGQKAMVSLKLENSFPEKIESARAVCFLLDAQGKMVGQSTKWVIGQNRTGLEPGATNDFNFVITSPQPFTTTDLTAKVSFSRLVLTGGKQADVRQEVVVTTAPK